MMVMRTEKKNAFSVEAIYRKSVQITAFNLMTVLTIPEARKLRDAIDAQITKAKDKK